VSAGAVSVVLCTVPVAEADRLAERVLEARLAACVSQLGPVRSRYWWDGRIESADEMLLVIKTACESVTILRDRLAEWHSYDVPEILEFRADSGLPGYLAWVRGECSSGGDD